MSPRANIHKGHLRWSRLPHLLEDNSAGSHISSESCAKGGGKIEERRRGEGGPVRQGQGSIGQAASRGCYNAAFRRLSNKSFVYSIQRIEYVFRDLNSIFLKKKSEEGALQKNRKQSSRLNRARSDT